jgi:biopolymer transport protein ExbB
MMELIQFWMNGGPVLWALFVLALLIYFPLCTLSSNVRGVLQKGDEGDGKATALLSHSMTWRNKETSHSLSSALHVAAHDRGLRLAVAAEVNQRLRHLNVLIHLAPLLGLFGTVNGIYQTFRALADRNSTISDLMSAGISEALITTATGLLIAIPGVFLLQMTRQQLTLWVNSPCPFPELAIEEAAHLLEE